MPVEQRLVVMSVSIPCGIAVRMTVAQIKSGRRLLKIVAMAYVVQAAAAFIIGFTLPFLRYFGVW